NRIYRIDPNMRCVEVVDRETREASSRAHRLVGARLTGGERPVTKGGPMEVFHPLPVPGSLAVFLDASQPRRVVVRGAGMDRVVLRVYMMAFGGDQPDDSWAEITAHGTLRMK